MTKLLERIIYAIALIFAILSFFIGTSLMTVLLIGFSLIYFGFGWYLLNPNKTNGFGVYSFFLGYSYSSALLSMAFRTKDYPLTETLHFVSIAFLVIMIILLFLQKKADSKIRNENVFKTLLLLIFSIISLLIYIQ